jgi:hypothetical protein
LLAVFSVYSIRSFTQTNYQLPDNTTVRNYTCVLNVFGNAAFWTNGLVGANVSDCKEILCLNSTMNLTFNDINTAKTNLTRTCLCEVCLYTVFIQCSRTRTAQRSCTRARVARHLPTAVLPTRTHAHSAVFGRAYRAIVCVGYFVDSIPVVGGMGYDPIHVSINEHSTAIDNHFDNDDGTIRV